MLRPAFARKVCWRSLALALCLASLAGRDATLCARRIQRRPSFSAAATITSSSARRSFLRLSKPIFVRCDSVRTDRVSCCKTSPRSTSFRAVVKDNMRITVVSLAEGDERLHLTAQDSALFAPAGLLAVSEGGGRVQLYDLVAGARKDRYSFPENIAYMRFSADGGRLLVLTEYQNVSVIDLTQPAAKPSATSP